MRSSIVALSLLMSLPATAQVALAATTVRGEVRDAGTDRPLAGVFVQQDGALASAFTDPDGRFSLTLDPGAAKLTLTADGYEPLTVDAGKGGMQKLKLKPITVVRPQDTPPKHPVIDREEVTPIGALDSQVTFGYRLRNETETSNNATLSGWSNNDYRLALRYRWNHLLVEAEGAHVQSPVDVASLPRELNPAFSPSTYEGRARLGYVTPLKGGWEGALDAVYRYRSTVPNNHDIPYIGNGADYEQTRHAAGANLTLGWSSVRSPWGVELGAAYFPLVWDFAKAPGSPFANQNGLEAHAELTYEIVHGLRLGVDYQYEGWHGNGDDTVHLVTAQFHYTPVGMFKGSER